MTLLNGRPDVLFMLDTSIFFVGIDGLTNVDWSEKGGVA
jgi:hypothetical protein